MAANNKNDQIDIRVKLKPDVEELNNVFDEIQKRTTGAKRRKVRTTMTAAGDYKKQIGDLMQKKDWGTADYDNFVTLTNQYAAELQKLISNLGTVNSAIQSIADKIKQTNTALATRNNERREIYSKVRTDKDGNVRFTRDFEERLAKEEDLQLYTLGSNNRKYRVTDAKTAFQRYEEKNLYSENPNVKVDELMTAEQQISKQIQERLTTLNTEIDKLKQIITDQQSQLKAATNKEGSKLAEPSKMAAAVETARANINTGASEEQTEVAKKSSEVQDGLNQKIIDVSNNLNKQQNALGKALKNFTLYATVINTVRSALNEAKSTIIELDRSLTEQAMVTGLTREETYSLVSSYQALALQVGATTKEIAEVATEYMKQGQTVRDSLTLTEAAVSAAKVARVSVGDSINYLTTALNGYQLSAEQAMNVSDKFAAVAAASASDYDELAIALSKVASQANLAGMSMDYTIALLTKGLETTREAPETMGTALKTIIARMREMTDYGETLDDNTDVNNVESQLAYVGIALRDEQGELRNTEDVLDELGRKWNDLNKNQQAALAKALAGTRQQSRLIALMDGYERVIELQQISQESTGATAAQASVYLEGIEASLNKLQVAWEGVVQAFNNSGVITAVLNAMAGAVEGLGAMANNDFGMVLIITTIFTILNKIIGVRRLQLSIQKQSLELQNMQAIAALKERQQEIIAQKMASTGVKFEATQLKAILAQIDAQQELNKAKKGETVDQAKIQQAQVTLNSLGAEVAQLDAQVNTAINSLKTGHDALSLEYQNNIKQIDLLATKQSSMFNLSNTWLQATIVGQMVRFAIEKLITNEMKRQAILNKVNPIMAVATAALVAVTAITALVSWFSTWNSKVEQTAEDINELSNQIYTLNQQTTNLQSAIDTFDELDKKIIKTKEDAEEMHSALEDAIDQLDEEDKETYNALTTDEEKRQFLETTIANNEAEMAKAREEIINKLNDLSSSQWQETLDRAANGESAFVKELSAIYASSNQKVYDLVNGIEDLSSTTAANLKNVTTEIIASMDYGEALNFYNRGGIESLVDSLTDLGDTMIDTDKGLKEVSWIDLFTSEDYTIKQRAEAYQKIVDTLGEGSDEAIAFVDAFQEWDDLINNLGSSVIDLADKLNMSIDDLNDLYNNSNLVEAGVDISQDEYIAAMSDALAEYTKTSDIQAAILNNFGSFLNQFDKSSEEYINAYNAIINTLSDTLASSILDIGQNDESLRNTINNLYEKASGWNDLSESEKTEFLQDNADLFAGDAALWQAFQQNNYDYIEQALSQNEVLLQRRNDMLKQLQATLDVEKARQGEDYNASTVAYLEQEIAYWSDLDNIFRASLETQIDLQDKQLDEYKSFLEAQQDALDDALDKRREAYEDYFDAINDQEEDEDYYEQAATLMANITKLGASTNGSAAQQRNNLLQQLEDLEKERLNTLRERGQDAVLDSIDDTIDSIDNKFDSLLDNNKLMLQALTQGMQNPDAFLAQLLTNKINSGATAAEIEQWWTETLPSIFGGLAPNFNWDDFNVEGGTNNNLVLNVNGSQYQLSNNDQQQLFDTIMRIMNSMGIM